MHSTIRQLIAVLFCTLLLVQQASAVLSPMQMMDSEQPTQVMSHESMDNSHECCDEIVKSCCDSCEAGCTCPFANVYQTFPRLVAGPGLGQFEPLRHDNSIYYFQLNDLPERPPRF